MKVTTCQCRKCGKIHVFEKFGARYTHVCECGKRMDRWSDGYRMGESEIQKEPNEPHKNKECESGWVWWKQRMGDEKLGFVFVDDNQKVNAIPCIATGSKLVFRTTTPHRREDREELAREYTDKLGIKCEVVDARTELVAVIDG